ncbi:TM2 domain-containing protein [Novosphingopyxis sp. YJ-S2-01]|uniref:TM2 domain-containing protein n=1 Tax=Novosphingopyxis sp. YJ-S2-01 TaxID=2794021 RepID=UPI0018DD6AEB|nr:TM2 domain-containing protein [Novosphingopyxis sp. YJ-S2-01]MBH9537529.1 NINE protein [Novosphingopyxis sp. YJ-S2-01]
MNEQLLIKDGVHCRECGSNIARTASTCPHCGGRQSVGKSSGFKSKTTAILLALFLGGIGAHRFYLGNVGLGLLYLVFCWTFIPAIVAFGEMIYFLTISEEDFAERYS